MNTKEFWSNLKGGGLLLPKQLSEWLHSQLPRRKALRRFFKVVLVGGAGFGADAFFSACRSRRGNPHNLFSPEEVEPAGPRDVTIMTVLPGGVDRPVYQATVAYGDEFRVRSETDESGIAQGVNVAPREPVVFSGPDCFKYATPLYGLDTFYLRTESVSDPKHAAALHEGNDGKGSFIRLPGIGKRGATSPTGLVTLVYPREIWADPWSRENAEQVCDEFSGLSRYAERSVRFVPATALNPAGLNVSIIVGGDIPDEHGGYVRWWAWNYLIYEARVNIRESWYMRSIEFVRHELGHALGFRHTEGFAGFMDPASMYAHHELDPLSVATLLVSWTRNAGTEILDNVEIDPGAVAFAQMSRMREAPASQAELVPCRAPDPRRFA